MHVVSGFLTVLDGLVVGYVLVFFAVNLGSAVIPNSRGENSPSLQKALWIAAATPQDAWVCAQEKCTLHLLLPPICLPLNQKISRCITSVLYFLPCNRWFA